MQYDGVYARQWTCSDTCVILNCQVFKLCWVDSDKGNSTIKSRNPELKQQQCESERTSERTRENT